MTMALVGTLRTFGAPAPLTSALDYEKIEMTSNSDLLRTIQDGALSTHMPVVELLRRCQVLAARQKIPDLGTWVQHELNGYPDNAELPAYRVLPGHAMGHFTGPFGSGIRNAVLPATNLPEELQHWAREAQFRQPIATLEEISRRNDDSIRCAWPGDLVAMVQMDFYEKMALGQAWLSISKSGIIGAIESVRNRILTFALEAEAVVKDHEIDPPAASSRLSQTFHTVVYGNVGNIAQASSSFAQSAGDATGDLESLIRELSKFGVSSSDSDELRTAIAEDGPLKEQKIGGRVAGWMGGMIAKAIDGTWSVATSTATQVLPKLIAKYYGLPD
jgi:hypothetical protein